MLDGVAKPAGGLSCMGRNDTAVAAAVVAGVGMLDGVAKPAGGLSCMGRNDTASAAAAAVAAVAAAAAGFGILGGSAEPTDGLPCIGAKESTAAAAGAAVDDGGMVKLLRKGSECEKGPPAGNAAAATAATPAAVLPVSVGGSAGGVLVSVRACSAVLLLASAAGAASSSCRPLKIMPESSEPKQPLLPSNHSSRCCSSRLGIQLNVLGVGLLRSLLGAESTLGKLRPAGCCCCRGCCISPWLRGSQGTPCCRKL